LCHGSKVEAEVLLDDALTTVRRNVHVGEDVVVSNEEEKESGSFSISNDATDHTVKESCDKINMKNDTVHDMMKEEGRSIATDGHGANDCSQCCCLKYNRNSHLKDSTLLQRSENTTDVKTQRKIIQSLFVASPYTPPYCPVLFQLCCEILRFQLDFFENDGINTDDDDDKNNSKLDNDSGVQESSQRKKRQILCKKCHAQTHQRCKLLVEQMSKDGCIYLLQNWLLSLSICDVSFFVSFSSVCQPRITKARGEEQEQTPGRCNNINNETNAIPPISMQGTNGPGVINVAIPSLFLDNASSDDHHKKHLDLRGASFLYELKVIDCDLKPARKLCNRDKSESVYRLYGES